MCGRGVSTVPAAELSRIFRADIIDPGIPAPSWNVKPTQIIPIIVGDPPERRVTPARWSVVPPWSPELKLSFPTFNARCETAAEKPTFRAAVRDKRCLVPFDGYYEWRPSPAADGGKIPYFIHPIDTNPLFLAGLFSWWQHPDSGEWTLTATILTRQAAGILADVHDRMPMMVPPERHDSWLNPRVAGNSQLLADVSDAGLSELSRLEVFAVAPIRGDGPSLIVPA